MWESAPFFIILFAVGLTVGVGAGLAWARRRRASFPTLHEPSTLPEVPTPAGTPASVDSSTQAPASVSNSEADRKSVV